MFVEACGVEFMGIFIVESVEPTSSFWLQDVLKELQIDLERARKGKPPLKDADGKTKRNLSPEA